jgi:hypothetical protein
VNQKTEDNYKHAYSSKLFGAYKDRDPEDMLTGGIAPTHELELKGTDESVHVNRQSIHRRHFDQTRFGDKPWVKAIFYYRSRLAIENAGCVSRPDQYAELEAVEDGTFVRADPKERRKSKDNDD